MKYHIKTYGCQMNYSDSERIMAVLEKDDYQKTLSEDKADLIVINMCSIRKSAVDRIAGNFKKYKKYKKKNPKLKIVLTGCVLESDKERFEKLFDLVVDIKEIRCWLHSLHRSGAVEPKCKSLANRLHSSAETMEPTYFQIKPLYQSKFSAYIPIMTGCNNFCSYCVVPYTRGREYSRSAKEIIGEITELINNKYKEIILLGQNVNSYESKVHKVKNQKCNLSFLRKQESVATLDIFKHANLNNKSNETNWIPASAGMTETVDFPKLLKLINSIPGNFWIRFLTSHPKDMTEELIKTISECEKVTPYIHLALQSGDDQILKKMNRKYTVEHFLNLIKIVRKYLPDASISTDIIVGFPGETEKQFQKTVEVMRKAKFDMVYINKYSPRFGTTSYELKDNIIWQEKKRREKILTEILKETALENNQKYIGKIVEVLIDKVENNFIYGKTRSFKNVKIGIMNQELGIKEGKFLKTKITKARVWNSEGKIVK